MGNMQSAESTSCLSSIRLRWATVLIVIVAGTISLGLRADSVRAEGRGDIYYKGDTASEGAKLVKLALDQMPVFKDVEFMGSDQVGCKFDDSKFLISPKFSLVAPDRLVCNSLLGTKQGIRADDCELLRTVNELNAKYNTAKFSVIKVGEAVIVKAEFVIAFNNFLDPVVLVEQMKFYETATDAIIAGEAKQLGRFFE